MSLDALRGFDMFWILGADALMNALGRASSRPFVKGLAAQFDHAEWAGLRFYDLIFPLFIFVVGVSLVFSLGRTIDTLGRGAAYKRIIRRSVLLFVIALLYSGGIARLWPDMRLMGVLNRIAICYLVAGLLFCHFRWKGLVSVCATLLIGYWALLTFLPYPDVRPRTPEGELVSAELTTKKVSDLNFDKTYWRTGVVGPGLNLSNYIDQRFLPGRKYDGTWDPEGLLSTLPAIATCLLGVLAGLLLQSASVNDRRKVAWLIGAGAAGATLGWIWGLQFPVIKKIWTSSFVLVTAGYSAILLGVFYQIVDVWNRRTWAQPFVWIGMNAITLYLVASVLSFPGVARRFVGGNVAQFLNSSATTGAGDVLIAAVAVSLVIVFARFLYQRKIFLRF